MEPIELTMMMNEMPPRLTPMKSFRSSRVGPITPSTIPRTANKNNYFPKYIQHHNPPRNALRSTTVLMKRCHGYLGFSTSVDCSDFCLNSIFSIFTVTLFFFTSLTTIMKQTCLSLGPRNLFLNVIRGG